MGATSHQSRQARECDTEATSLSFNLGSDVPSSPRLSVRRESLDQLILITQGRVVFRRVGAI